MTYVLVFWVHEKISIVDKVEEIKKWIFFFKEIFVKLTDLICI